MNFGGSGYLIMTILGGFLLAAVIAWAALKNKKAKGSIDHAERSTRELYAEEDRAHQAPRDSHP
jgi:hypothetical protein